MVCGGFACSRNALCALNVVYVLVALLLIAVAAWGRAAGLPGVPLTGGAIAVGVVLLLLALLGLLGAARHHQVLLFFVSFAPGGAPNTPRGPPIPPRVPTSPQCPQPPAVSPAPSVSP
ncbi:hypothetical protein AV530_010288 [Patagioenas fasciata monilis]|uniref:Uncharacterized protein n=1 Tax=Patagioenas fasciata monilis TaxID=372326 RepID=A0A1V4JR46_PATFA|nr:hypothetical protein AV530_010288 [Patagioenas fasciata monilis]